MLLLPFTAATAHESHLTFVADRAAERMAEKQARDLVQFARVELNLKLDWSDASIARIEDVAADLHADYRRDKTAFTELDPLLQRLGSYVGEVFRRNHGGVWGFVHANGKRILAMKATDSGTVLWPVERVRQRIRGGATNNVWTYYQTRVAIALR
ncbi:MAG: DUF3806 domain-containing protein [Gammaproteobacteria bacterium]|nr:DUF3806 domain-containing protein [Gammaproteobacteria bacterium]